MRRALVLCLGLLGAMPLLADNTPQTLPFSQNWANTGLITVTDSWSGVPGITGYRGDNLTTTTGVDPQTVLADGTNPGVPDVNANQTNPNTYTTGGVTEFHLADPVVALQGSGTADAPFLMISLDTTGSCGILVSYVLRDIDGSADNAIQPVALQYRVGTTGTWTNVASAFVADASSGPSLATLTTSVAATLPAAADNQPVVQVRIITTDAAGSDEWIGIDDINITGGACGPALSVNDVSLNEGDSGTTTFTFTVSLNAPAGAGGVTFDIATADGTASAGSDYVSKNLTGQTIAAGLSTYAFDVIVNGDTAVEPSETFFVNVTNVAGASVADGQGLGTIANDDSLPTISINDAAVNEGNTGQTSLNFTTTLSFASGTNVTVDFATSDGTATTADGDYIGATGTVTFLPGETSKTVTVSVNGDTKFEPDETLLVTLTNPSANATILDPQATGTIRNDDLQPRSIPAVQTPVTENFDTLVASGTSSVTPIGWTFSESGTNANTTYTAGTGSSNSGDTYSFGTSSDRAFGGLQSSSLIPTIGGLFQNDTGTTITNLRISFTGEQWRLGALARADRLDFQYSTSATSLTSGTWTNADGLDFSSPTMSGTAGALDGNATANRTLVTYTITGLNIPAGGQIWIRWTDYNASSSDDGLAIDDFSIEANVAVQSLTIPQVQGAGAATPYAGQPVQTSGVVTALKSNGFFMQNAAPDADVNTSEAIFVMTGSAPGVAIGDLVQVTGTATEYYDLTEITTSAAGVTITSSGNPIPAAIALSPTILSPTGTQASNLEKYEGMLLTGALTTLTPTDQFFETWTFLTGTPRPMREIGLEASKPLPPGAPSGIPRFDENPERLLIDADGIAGNPGVSFPSLVNLGTLTGPLDYTFGNYKLLPLSPLTAVDRPVTPVRAGTSGELTIASFNIENFGTGLGSGDYARKLDKSSLVIRRVLNYPDIIGMVEVEDQSALDALVARVNSDAASIDSQAPAYVGYLIEANGTAADDDQDVAFIVKSSRVTVGSVEQGLVGGVRATYVEPGGATAILNDREPLILRATARRSPVDPSLPVTVIVNHLRSLIDIDQDPGDGPRVREKRRKQAEYLANLVQSLRATEPNIILVGDFNSLQFNDGYVDVIGTVKGQPTPADQVTLASPDLVNPDLTDLITTLPLPEQYTFTFTGFPQDLDHIIVTPDVMPFVNTFAIARNNADYPETALYSGNATRPERISDHDIAVAYLTLPVGTVDLRITNQVAGPAFYVGVNMAYTVTVANAGPGTAANVIVSDPIPSGMTFVQASTSQGTCSGTSTVTCNVGTLASGASATITIVMTPTTTGSVTNTASVTSDQTEVNPADNTSSANVTILAAAQIPTATSFTLFLLAAALAAFAAVKLRS